MAGSGLVCAACGTPASQDQRFCEVCGAPIEPPRPAAPTACANCGSALHEGARFCAACGQPVVVQPLATQCPSCGATRRPGARFCAACGTTVGAPGTRSTPRAVPSATVSPTGAAASPSAWFARLTWSSLAAAIGFLAALIGAFGAWVTAGPFSAGAFDDNARFRIGDWLGTSSVPVDGILVAALAVAGLAALWFSLSNRIPPSRGRLLVSVAAGALVAVGVLEMQYVTSEGGPAVDWGMGLYLIVAGGAVASLSPLIPERPLTSGQGGQPR